MAWTNKLAVEVVSEFADSQKIAEGVPSALFSGLVIRHRRGAKPRKPVESRKVKVPWRKKPVLADTREIERRKVALLGGVRPKHWTAAWRLAAQLAGMSAPQPKTPAERGRARRERLAKGGE